MVSPAIMDEEQRLRQERLVADIVRRLHSMEPAILKQISKSAYCQGMTPNSL